MNSVVIAQFAFATLLPAVACVLLALARKNPRVAALDNRAWQVIVGAVFGCIAIYGTEAGIPVDGAMMNVRDAAPLAAGLLFGGPAGIIAGLIGGIERWFSVMWGVGAFTQVACTLGTIFAGVYAALLRKFMFERNIPNLAFAFSTGVVAEVMHLTLVFITRPDQIERALEVARVCALPMILCVGVATLLCSLAMSLVEKKPLITPASERNVVRILHSRMLVATAVALIVTIGFTAVLQNDLSQTQTNDLLSQSAEDVKRDIAEASDSNLLELTQVAAQAMPTTQSASSEQCATIAEALDVAEINVIDANGIIVASTFSEYIGFDMASGEQSAEFLALLPGGSQTQLVQGYRPIAFNESTMRKYAGIAIEDGLVQVGYDPKNFLDDLAVQIEASVKNRHVGETGVLVVVDEAGGVVSTYRDVDNLEADRLVADASNAAEGAMFATTLNDVPCYASYLEVESYRVIAALPKLEANAARNASILVTAFMEVLIFAVLFLLIYAVIKRVVVKGVRTMNSQLSQITAGDLNVKLDVRTASELSSLSDGINKTVGALKESLALVKADLNMAASIQTNTLPDLTAAIKERREFDLFASMDPAREVGGDFYDFFMVDDDHIALVVADVSGKGIPAALFMMQSKAVIKMEALSGVDPATVFLRANTDLSEKNDDDMFTTAWIGVLEISTGKLTYADAGHEKLVLYRNGEWEMPKKPNGAVALGFCNAQDYEGLSERYRFRNHTVQLQPGDAILQYTDGVTDATNLDEDLFGEKRLLQTVREAPSADPSELLFFVSEHISEFVGEAPQFDDITMLGLRYKGSATNQDATDDEGVR